MHILKSIHGKLIKLATSPQYAEVPTTTREYLERTPSTEIIWRIARKYILLLIFAQVRLEVKNIPPKSKVLFLYTGKKNFGDAILELSGRILLEGQPFSIDLLALPHIASFFEDDKIFNKIYTDPNIARQNPYDYILISEFNQRSISLKIKYFKSYKFACMFRFFFGPDRSQTLFSFFAFNDIFKLNLKKEFIKKTAKLSLWTSESVENKTLDLLPKNPYIVIAVGGIDQSRTYENWIDFIHIIDQNNINVIPDHVVLIGSDNGIRFEKEIINANFDKINVSSLINKTSIKQCQTIIKNAKVFLGVDGGLMHIAHTTKTNTVILFGKEPYHLRVTNRPNSFSIQAKNNVNEVLPIDVANALIEAIE